MEVQNVVDNSPRGTPQNLNIMAWWINMCRVFLLFGAATPKDFNANQPQNKCTPLNEPLLLANIMIISGMISNNDLQG